MAMKTEDGPGSPQAGAGQDYLDQVVPALYAELRLLARQRLRRSPLERSLNTTDLVHEAYIRLIQSGDTPFRSRDHFLATCSRVMRNVLVDHARARIAAKRGGGMALGRVQDVTWVADVDLDRVVEVHEALLRLGQLDERQARMVEQRYFGGLTLGEIAAVTGLSLATVKRELRAARAWLAEELQAE